MEIDQLRIMDESFFNKMISVLYIHHSGTFGGASRSLLEMINGFPEGSVKAHLIVQNGNVVKILEEMGLPFIQTRGISQFDNTRYGHYRGVRWLLLIREFFYIPFTLSSIFRAKRIWKNIDLVHVNEVTMLLPLILAKLIFKKPVIVHMRSVQNNGGILVSAIVGFVLRGFADRVIAIDHTVANSAKCLVQDVVHNGFSPKGSVGDKESINPLNHLSSNSLKVAMVGNPLPSKGSYDFLEAAYICKQKRLDVDFVIIGGRVRQLTGPIGFLLKKLNFAKDVMGDLTRYILEHGLQNNVHFFPVTTNIRPFYENIDVVCFPSHLNAVGRPVFEAAFSKVPSIIAIRNPLEDTFINNQTGIQIDEKNPTSLVRAIEYFCSYPDEILRMGNGAYELAMKNFDSKKNSAFIVKIYKEILGIT